MFSVIKSYHTTKSAQDLQRNIFAAVNFQRAVLWADVENCMLAILTFFTTVKLLQLSYFNMYTRAFSHAPRIWMRDLLYFLFVLLVLFLAFMLTGILLFGSRIGHYSRFWPAFCFQLEIVLGKVKARPINELIEANLILGRTFVTLLLMGITVTMMNFFISALNDAVCEAKTMEVKKEHKQDTRENQADIHTSNLTKNTQVGTGKPQSRKAAKSSKQRSEMFLTKSATD